MRYPVDQIEIDSDLQTFEERASEEAIPFDEFLTLLKEAGAI
jgi:hypothetical protein